MSLPYFEQNYPSFTQIHLPKEFRWKCNSSSREGLELSAVLLFGKKSAKMGAQKPLDFKVLKQIVGIAGQCLDQVDPSIALEFFKDITSELAPAIPAKGLNG